MPKAPVYQRQAVSVTPPNARVQAFGDANAYGAGVAQQMGQLGATVSNIADEQQVKLNQIAVSNAISNTQKSLIPINVDILNRKGANALGTQATQDKPATLSATQDFEAQTKALYDKQLAAFNNPVQKAKYAEWYQSVYPGMLQSATLHERKQLDLTQAAANESQLNANSDSYVSNVLLGNYDQANRDLRNGVKLSNSIGDTNGIPLATQTENSNKYIYGSIGKAVDTLIANSRPEDAKKVIDYYGDKLPESQKALHMAKIGPALEQNEVYTYVSSLKADPAYKNPDGTFNSSKANEAAEAKYTSRTRKVTKPGTPGNDGGFESFINAISGQESGGDYSAVNARTGAAGKFQIMPENWAPWSKQAGLPPGAPMTPENQELVARHMLKQLYDAHGPKGAAIAWYAGEGALNYSEDARNRKQGAGDEPSINDYAASVVGRMGGTPGTPGTTEDVPDPDLIGLKLAKAQIAQAGSESNVQHKQMVENSMYAFDQWLAAEKPTSIAAIEAKARELGFQGPDLIGAIGKGKGYAGLIKAEENENTHNLFEEALGKMYRGEITTKGELDTQYGGSLPYDKLITLGNSLGKEMKWANGENLMAFNGVLTDKKIKGSEKSLIFEKINQQVAAYHSKGIPVTASDIRDWTEEQTQKVIINRSWYGRKDQIDLSYVPAGWDVRSDGVYTDDGQKIDSFKDGKFYITKNGVDIEVKP